jgi:hypothetical protein
MKILLQAFHYYVDQRNICEGLKVTGVLIGVQAGFTNFCCFLFLCDRRSAANITSGVTGNQGRLKRREKTVSNTPLINPMKIFLPPLHINLELIKCLLKAMG